MLEFPESRPSRRAPTAFVIQLALSYWLTPQAALNSLMGSRAVGLRMSRALRLTRAVSPKVASVIGSASAMNRQSQLVNRIGSVLLSCPGLPFRMCWRGGLRSCEAHSATPARQWSLVSCWESSRAAPSRRRPPHHFRELQRLVKAGEILLVVDRTSILGPGTRDKRRLSDPGTHAEGAGRQRDARHQPSSHVHRRRSRDSRTIGSRPRPRYGHLSCVLGARGESARPAHPSASSWTPASAGISASEVSGRETSPWLANPEAKSES